MRPIKVKNLVHTIEVYRPSDKTKEQTIGNVKVDRATAIDLASFGSNIVGNKYDNMVVMIDAVNSTYSHMDIKAQDKVVFKGSEYTVVGILTQTANKEDKVHHWEVLLI